MTASARSSPSDAFGPYPSFYATSSAAASLLGHGLPTAMAEKMLGVPKLRERLDAALFETLGELPSELTPAQSTIAALDPTGLTRFALRTGAAWHASQIARVYDGPTVRALAERIGGEFRESALADLASAPPALSDNSGTEVPLAELPTAIARDGIACLVAWCEAQPRPVGFRVLLRIRMNARPTQRHLEFGPELIDRLAAANMP